MRIIDYLLTNTKATIMFDFHLKSLSDVLKELTQISNEKIKQKAAFEQPSLESNINETLSEIFQENGLEHVGKNQYSNKTHGEITEETLVISVNKKIIDTKEELKLEIEISTKIGNYEDEFYINIRHEKGNYWIEKRGTKEEKIFTTGTMKDEIKEELEKGFNHYQ